MKKGLMILFAVMFMATGCIMVVHDRYPQTTYVQSERYPVQQYSEPPASQADQSTQVVSEDSSQIYTNQSVDESYEDEGDDIVITEGPEQVWVAPISLGVDILVPGFWRPRLRVGFNWINGYWEHDVYIPGFWKPIKTYRTGYVWVPGYWHGSRWIKGRWRESNRAGYIWVAGHWDRNGQWVYGTWKPIHNKPGEIWVNGYWDHSGHWRDGYWRPAQRSNFIWVDGYYNGNGIWITGSWKPVQRGKVWERGYWDRRGEWVPGYWREERKIGYIYSRGRYDQKGQYQEGAWVKEVKPQQHGYNSQRDYESKPAPGKSKMQEQIYQPQTQSGGSKLQEKVEKEEAYKDYQKKQEKRQYNYQQNQSDDQRSSKMKSRVDKVIVNNDYNKVVVKNKQDKTGKKADKKSKMAVITEAEDEESSSESGKQYGYDKDNPGQAKGHSKMTSGKSKGHDSEAEEDTDDQDVNTGNYKKNKSKGH